MNREIRLLSALALALACLVSAGAARGQDDLMWVLNPRLGQAKAKARYTAEGYPTRRVRGQAAEFGYASHDLKLTLPLLEGPGFDWSLSTKLEALDINTGVKLPGFAEAFPEDLWDISLGTAYRRRLDDGWTVGVSGGLGSASDAPFAGAGETTFTSTGFVRIPSGDNDAWLMMLHFRTELDRLRGAPLLPGAGYHWVRDERFQALVGLPYAWAQYAPVEPLTFSAMGGPFRARAKGSYALTDDLKLYAAYDWSGRRFVRHDRRHGNERLFFYGQSVSTGLRWQFGEHLSIDAGGGYAFDRFIFEGKGYHNRHDRRFRIGDTPFVALQVGWNF